ncbi:MAG: hypothetical protein ACR2PK_00415, partial [Acidimicrobiales bacterium]
WTIKDYFHDWRNDPAVWAAHSVGESIAAQSALQADDDVSVNAVGEFFYSVIGALQAPGAFDQLIPEDDVYPLPLAGDGDELLIVGPGNQALIAEHSRMFGEQAIERFQRGDALAAAVVRLDGEQVRERQGMTASYTTDNSSTLLTRNERVAGDTSPPVPLPARGRWEGLLLVEQAGTYSLALAGLTGTELEVDGKTANPLHIDLELGPHHLVVAGRLTGEPIEFRWEPPLMPTERIPAKNLWLSPEGPRGLWGQAFEGVDGTGAVSRSRIDPSIDFTIGQPEAQRPRLLRWSGYIDVPEDGLYVLGVDAASDWELRVSGRVLSEPARRLYMTQGWHKIEMEIVDPGSAMHVRLHWARPGTDSETVPSGHLVPPWTLSADQVSEADLAEVRFRDVHPDPVGAQVDHPIASAASGGTIALAGASGEVWIWRTGGTGHSLDLGHAISDIAVGPHGDVIALDPAGRLIEVNLSGSPAVLVEDEKLASARGLDIGEDGSVVVAGTASDQLLRLNRAGLVPVDSPPVVQPIDVLVIDPQRTVVVDVDPMSVRLLNGDRTKWELPLSPATTVSGPHLARLGDHVLVTDPVAGSVLVLDLQGQIVGSHTLLLGDGQPASPVGVAVTAAGSVFVADTTNEQILEFRTGLLPAPPG